jgi:hypothetical protein
MIRRLSIALALVLSLASSQPVFAFGSGDAGTSGAAFLKIGPGARPAGMGEAFTGVADDIHTLYYNPAGLSRLEHPELTAMHMQWFQNIDYEYAAFAYPTKSHGTWAFSISNLHTDDIQRRTEDTDAAIDEFGSSDSAYTLGYAYPLNKRLSLGGSAKFIRQTLDSASANAYAMDGGVTYDMDWKDLRLGGSVQNIGTETKFLNDSDPLPLTFRLGASARPFTKDLLLSSDLIMPRDHDIGFALGGEYRKTIRRSIIAKIRSGYRTDTDVSGLSGVAAGGGLEFGRVSLDFAWVPFGDLGNSYRYSLHVKFGPADDEKPGVMEKASDDSEPVMSFLEK